MPASRPSITPKKCGRLPAPEVAYDDLPGFAFAHTTDSVHVFAPDCGPAATANWNVEPMPIGAKSLSGSYESVLYVCGTTAIEPIGITMIVVPSGAAAFTASAAMRPIAPGRFSTMTGCPIVSFLLSATTRAMTSAVPQAGNRTKILTGRSILSCATAGTAKHIAVAAMQAEANAKKRFIDSSHWTVFLAKRRTSIRANMSVSRSWRHRDAATVRQRRAGAAAAGHERNGRNRGTP